MGICLALSLLENGGVSSHGGQSEAVDELCRESFWMTDAELARAYDWALRHSPFLEVAIDCERTRRRLNAPTEHRVN